MNENTNLPVSLCIIARNEEEAIERCLSSIRDLVSEIIVVINDCTDDTKGVAEGMGAKVYEHPWHGDRDQRNIALKYVSQPWVLSCDTDEVFSPELRSSIIQFFKDGNSERYAGAYYARKSRFVGAWIKHGDWYPDCVIRLFRKDKGITAGSPQHAKVKVDGPMIKLKGDLLHYTADSLNDYVSKMPGFSESFLQQQLAEGKHWSAFQAISRSFWRFFRAYFIKLGFLDGYRGFFLAASSFYHTLHRYSKLYEHKEMSTKIKK